MRMLGRDKKPGQSGPTSRYRQVLFLGLGLLLLITGLSLAFTLTAMNIQASALAYVTASHHWFGGVSGTTHYLQRYLADPESRLLEKARHALEVPLGDLRARQEMEKQDFNAELARQHFLDARNNPADVDGMIWLFRNFRWIPQLQAAENHWRTSDPIIYRLRELAGELPDRIRQGGLSDAQRAEYRRELQLLQERASRLADAFAQEIASGLRLLNRGLVVFAVVVSLLVAFVLAYLGYRMMEWLRVRDRRFLAAFHQSAVGMAQLSLDGRIVDANEALCHILARPRAELINMPYTDLIHPDDREVEVEQRQQPAESDGRFSVEKRLLRGDGTLIQAKLTGAITRDEKNRPDQMICIIEDISAAHDLSLRLRYQARHDELTGLLNRREMQYQLEQALEETRRQNVSHVLCFLDLDRFKVVNDRCGHQAGDELLRSLGELLECQLRETDLVGRLGGDEFAVLLRRTDLEGAMQVAEKLREVITDHTFSWQGQSFRVGVSIGLAEMTRQVPDISSLLRRTDTACQQAKDRGRNRIQASQESLMRPEGASDGPDWEKVLKGALASGNLPLHAQRIQPASGETSGLRYEVLARLHCSDSQYYLPGAFLPGAQRLGLLCDLDCTVLEEVTRMLADHPRHLEQLAACHIDVSSAALDDSRYLELIRELLQRRGIPAGRLCFEITETAANSQLKGAQRFITAVREMGCTVALDDFGSGLSSFGYLKNLAVDFLKIDGSLIRQLDDSARDRALFRAVNEVGKSLRKKTIAESVETAECVRVLETLGVDYLQGYAIHRPEPLAGFVAGERSRLGATPITATLRKEQ